MSENIEENTYDSIFPSLPSNPNTNVSSMWTMQTSKLTLKTHSNTQVFQVPVEERRYRDVQGGFGNETNEIRDKLATKYGVKIELSCSKDQSLHILISGADDKVIEAKRAIISALQTGKERKIKVAKEFHKFIIGKSGNVLKELQEKTSTTITIPKSSGTGADSELISISGLREGIDQAIKDIQQIVDEQSRTGYEKLKIPKLYHAWIRGPYGNTMSSIIAKTETKINIPPSDVEKDEITVTGDKEKVDVAVAEINKIYNDKKRLNITKLQVQISQSQHKLIIGNKGQVVQDIFKDYDVYVHVPKPDSNSDTITLYGEESRLGAALTQVYTRANSIIKTQIDAPTWIHRYMIGASGAKISKITGDYPGTHVNFEDNDKITLEGPPDEIEKARERLLNIANELKSVLSVAEINIEPKYYGHLCGKSYENIKRMRNEYGVEVRMPAEGSSSTTIRIEGPAEGVAKAKIELVEFHKKLENERSKDVIIEQKYHSNLIGAGGKHITEIRGKFNDIQITIPNAKEKSDIVTVRGNKNDVEKCVKYLQLFVKELDESNYKEEMHVFKKLHKMIIGKQGASIRKIKDETSTRIDVPDDQSDSDVITITGKRENVMRARQLLDAKVKELVKIEEDSVSIAHALHKELIGRAGKLIKQIRLECGGVIINFPPGETPSDVITLKGPREDIDKAKAELLKIAHEKGEFTYSEEIHAKPEFYRYLIGSKGTRINEFREKFNVKIIFPSASDETSDLITIFGKEDNVKKARAELEATIKTLEEQTTDELAIEPKWQKIFLAKRGKLKSQVSEDNCNVDINFPKAQSSNVVTIKGAKEAVQTAKKRLVDLVAEFELWVTEDVQVEQKYHASIIGKKGETSQQIQDECRVDIQFPAKKDKENAGAEEPLVNSNSNSNSEPNVIKITGLKEDCDRAREAILALVPRADNFDFPSEYFRDLLADKGDIIQKITTVSGCQIKIPKKGEEVNHLTLNGTVEQITAAKEALTEQLAKIVEKNFTIEFDIKPQFIQTLRGRMGADAKALSDKFDCRIDFSRKGEPDKVIIRGLEKDALAAQDGILKVLESKVFQEIQIIIECTRTSSVREARL